MRHSAWAIGDHIRQAVWRDRAKEKATAERAARIDHHKNKKLAELMSPKQWVENYIRKHGGSVNWTTLSQNKNRSIVPNTKVLRAAVEESEILISSGDPEVISIQEQS